MKIFITGIPGIGKSTVLDKTGSTLRDMGFTVGGIKSPEIREKGRRIGFDVIDVVSGKRGVLARVDGNSEHRLGRYGVLIDEFESVALPALDYAVNECDIIVIDEIAPMELFSRKFQEKVKEILSNRKPVISVLHRRYTQKYRKKGEIITVKRENRDGLPTKIVSKLLRNDSDS